MDSSLRFSRFSRNVRFLCLQHKAREIGQRGGIASGIARRQRRQLRELLNDCMTAEVTDAEIKAALVAAGYEPSFENALTLAALTKAARGDIEALRYVRDTLGEKPTEQYNLAVSQRSVRSMDLSTLTDDELMRIADGLGVPPMDSVELEAADAPD